MGLALDLGVHKRLPRINQGEEAALFWCRALKLPDPVRNYLFHATRRWEIDLAWPDLKVGLEVQGGIWRVGMGAHSRPANIRRDMEKHNALLDLGWRVWCYEPAAVIRGTAMQHLAAVLGYADPRR